MVKFAGTTCYTEKMLTDLAGIAIGGEFLADETFIGETLLPGKSMPEPYIAISKIPDYRDIIDVENQKSHAQKFHPVYVFNALIGFDDSNEENFGIAGPDHKPKVIDYEPVANLISQKIQHQKIWFGSFRNFLFNFFAVFADFSCDLIRSFVGF